MSIIQKIWSGSKRKAAYLSGDARHILGLDKELYQNARGRRIVLYHNVCKNDPHKFNTLFLTCERFEEHLQYYKKYFNLVSLDDYYAGNFSNEKFNVCLTFDDGLANNYNYVLPLLTKYRVPATFFVTAIRNAGFDILWNDMLSIAGYYGPEKFTYKNQTYRKNRNNKYVDENGTPYADKLRSTGFNEKAALMSFLEQLTGFKANRQDDDYWLQMTSAQIKSMSASAYVTIGAHGYYHNDLARIPSTNAATEMAMSKEYLESLTGKPINSFAFPYGSYNGQVLKDAKAVGYNQLLATDFINTEDGQDNTMRERFTVNPFISTPNQLNAIIRGKYA
ncbi:polysaccharide deacetylase family protein [Mucilaginibacter sp. SMC90]|uniref:polysaccharide deacetylase family protein n=1 Tax=Mucilaginibacter sp. SMC90 TaxID=2929803 RepID=UPI001FB38D1D|nr:polysaccharide deacetylase family protein [Mucilaginibacter sp. SMC90]UOE51847.1 polysaccharide deacetylase family protein [Mucilaginibacter sp. SMC90]